MSGKGNISSKPKVRNILLIGSKSQTTDFIKRFDAFWKSFHVQPVTNTPKHASPTVILEIPTSFIMFEEQLCFIDSPKSMNSIEARNFYEVLINFKVIDAILVFTNDYLSDFKTYMQFFFTASNYPREKVVFIINRRDWRYTPNAMAIVINLEDNLKQLKMVTKVSQNKNLFLLDESFRSNEMLSLCHCLKNLFILQPCVFQFETDVLDLFDKISFVSYILIEILLLKNSFKIFVSHFTYTFCKLCCVKLQRPMGCHMPCRCLDAIQDLQNCSIFSSTICKNSNCGCSVEAHTSLKYYASKNVEFDPNVSAFERIAILHILATLYLFCKQSAEFAPIYKNLKQGYWSLATLSDITSDHPIYKEIEDKIKELESNSYKPTPEEVKLLLERLENTTWCNFDMKDIIETDCKLKIISNTQHMSAATSQATTLTGQKNVQRPIRFPEMKTKFVQNAHVNSTKYSVEDVKDAMLENLQKEMDELKKTTSKEKKLMQDQIADLKRQMEELKKQC